MKIQLTLAKMEVVNLQVINSVTLSKTRLTGIIGIGKSMEEKNMIIHLMQESHKFRTQLMDLKTYSFDRHSDN